MAQVTSGEMPKVNERSTVGDRTLTLGEVIDGFLHLSDSDKAIFMAATGLGSVSGGNSSKKTPQVGVPGSRIDPSSVVIPRTPALQQAAGIVQPGSTVDPKTGKVYRLQAPKELSKARIELTSKKEEARLTLVETCQSIGIEKTEEGPRKLSGEGDKAKLVRLNSDENRSYNAALAAFEAAKAALATYKAAHPEEFSGPAVKTASPIEGTRANQRGRGRGSQRGRGRGASSS